MRARPFLLPAIGLGVLLALSCITFSACTTTPKVDWDSRIGTYTYDQAVAELGPPDKAAKLSDGSTVADWIKRSNSSFSFGFGTGMASSHSAVGVGQTVNTTPGDKVLRLVFTPDNKLGSWSKNY